MSELCADLTCTNPGSGIYQVVPEKTHDTIYVSQDPLQTEDVEIPDPHVITYMIDNG